MEEQLIKVFQTVENLINSKTSFKIVLAKPRGEKWLKSTIYPFLVNDGIQLKNVVKSKTQEFTSVWEIPDFKKKILDQLENDFFFMDVVSSEGIHQVKQSKKGKLSVLFRKENIRLKPIQSHNKVKNYLIHPQTRFLHLLGLTTKEGKVHAQSQKKFKQINRFIELIEHLIKNNSISKIVDMGCGKGYLTFAMYEYLHSKYPEKNLEIKGYELRKELVDHCNNIAKECGYTGLSFVQGNIGELEIPNVDLLIALHACDIATDMAIAQGIHSEAKYMVLAPCCHKQVRKAMSKTNAITKHGIFKERQAEMVTDTIRSLLLESRGYKTSIQEFISSEHTAKNIMITAVKGQSTHENPIEEVKELKATYGVSYHYLERLLKSI